MEKYYEILTSKETMETFGGEDTVDEMVYEFIFYDGEMVKITRK